MFLYFYLFLIILCPSCIAYDRPGLSPRCFLVVYLCSRLDPLPYNPARHPAFIKAPRLLGSMPSYLLVLVVATADLHLLLSASLLWKGDPQYSGLGFRGVASLRPIKLRSTDLRSVGVGGFTSSPLSSLTSNRAGPLCSGGLLFVRCLLHSRPMDGWIAPTVAARYDHGPLMGGGWR